LRWSWGAGAGGGVFYATLPAGDEPGGGRAYHALLLTHTAVIAAGGIYANLRLLGRLERACGRWAARRVVIAWLAGNLFVGAQLSYTLRPFFGNPELPVQFLRPNPFEGNYYEALWPPARPGSPGGSGCCWSPGWR